MNFKVLTLVVLTTTVSIALQAGPAPPSKNEVIPLIEMDNVLLPDAIRQLARQAHLNIILDPRLAEPPLASMRVSVRWQGVSAKEALVALLDNYGLVLVE